MNCRTDFSEMSLELENWGKRGVVDESDNAHARARQSGIIYGACAHGQTRRTCRDTSGPKEDARELQGRYAQAKWTRAGACFHRPIPTYWPAPTTSTVQLLWKCTKCELPTTCTGSTLVAPLTLIYWPNTESRLEEEASQLGWQMHIKWLRASSWNEEGEGEKRKRKRGILHALAMQLINQTANGQGSWLCAMKSNPNTEPARQPHGVSLTALPPFYESYAGTCARVGKQWMAHVSKVSASVRVQTSICRQFNWTEKVMCENDHRK